VARFVGRANVVRGRVVSAQPGSVQALAWDGVPFAATADAAFAAGDAVDLAFRPESLELVAPGSRGPGFDAVVRTRTFLGATVELRCDAYGDPIVARRPSRGPAAAAAAGDAVRLQPVPDEVHAMPASGGAP
jgi:ABC-type Fe3+/spermidine/putrescine transport system ATPase subunit